MDGSAPFSSVKTTRSTCPYCGVGCGVKITQGADGTRSLQGDPDHPANKGRLCSKGSALLETIGLEDRLLHPVVDGHRADWDSAIARAASAFSSTIAQHGPESVAFYVSGQMLTEDYYVANKLMKGFIGTGNIDTNSRLCMASTVAGHRRAFGTDTVPGCYEDLELADLVVLVGSNLAWCHPVLYQRIVAAKAERPEMRVVNIDPRRTATCDIADLHLPLKSGSDVALFNTLLAEISRRGACNWRYINDHVSGFMSALGAARASDPDATGLSRDDINAFCDMWIGTEKVVTVFSQGVNQSSNGTDKVNAIINCHLATGRIGRPGMGPFSVTGQPNAMGGREVGGLANMLANHLDIDDQTHRDAVKKFWNSPRIAQGPGRKAVDLFQAVADGKIKALWIIGTNPAVSMPDADLVRDAIELCDFVAVSDVTARTDTARLADVLFPALGWGEKDGTVTNSERRISRQRPFLPAPGEARADWRIICDVACAMGWSDAFTHAKPADVFREHAQLSRVTASFGLDFDISALSEIGDTDYETLHPFRWPVGNVDNARLFGDGGFYTPDRRARMIPVRHSGPAKPDAYPLVLNTGRVRDHWHTLTRTGKSARLSKHIAEPYLEIHPDDARQHGLKPADIAAVQNPTGRALLRVLVTDRVRPGEMFAPMHWTGEFTSEGRIDAVVPSRVDPVSGQPESKAAPVKVSRFDTKWFGFAVASNRFQPDCAYWARSKTQSGWQCEMAGDTFPEDWTDWAQDCFGLDEVPRVVVEDARRSGTRIAFLCDGKLLAALFIGPQPIALARNYLGALPGLDASADVLSGWPGADRPDPGPTVCACFDVGANTILAAIDEKRLVSVDAIGDALRAGTNCGSCRPELRRLLEQSQRLEAAE
ncbi:nitrate reductase [Qingshengfaniella alkalisoli]|uniref:Molybdopterin-dependent oxidoreductase n=1 Tax=Qingshengfaniella alkalisoli TaxID=2599296 RepID=A0A5B8IWC5_9RHOB|nr:nitrate reductase [Qingshengfaniella alkalisoli]QDY68828.1 molybdopterin-dependent oxidoreductase [Qingshengfaniella alkalisoli]